MNPRFERIGWTNDSMIQIIKRAIYFIPESISHLNESNELITEWLIDWKNDWLIESNELITDWLIDWLIERMIDWLT